MVMTGQTGPDVLVRCLSVGHYWTHKQPGSSTAMFTSQGPGGAGVGRIQQTSSL